MMKVTVNGLFHKKTVGKGGGRELRTYFSEIPAGIFHLFTLPQEIPGKAKLHPWKFHKIVSDPW